LVKQHTLAINNLLGQGEARLEGVALGRNKITREVLLKGLLSA
jgi:hypothetical protein